MMHHGYPPAPGSGHRIQEGQLVRIDWPVATHGRDVYLEGIVENVYVKEGPLRAEYALHLSNVSEGPGGSPGDWAEPRADGTVLWEVSKRGGIPYIVGYPTGSEPYRANPLTFYDETVGAHHGQTDAMLIAYEGDNPVGGIDYVVYEGDVHISHVEVKESHRRRGVAAQLFRELSRLHPDARIHGGYLSEEGAAFAEGLPARMQRDFEPNAPLGDVVVDLVGADNTLLDGVHLAELDPDVQRDRVLIVSQVDDLVRRAARNRELDAQVEVVSDEEVLDGFEVGWAMENRQAMYERLLIAVESAEPIPRSGTRARREPALSGLR